MIKLRLSITRPLIGLHNSYLIAAYSHLVKSFHHLKALLLKQDYMTTQN